MPASDFFLTLAQVSLGIVGFSAVVIAVREVRTDVRSRFQRFLARILIEGGLACLFLSLLPLVLDLLGVPPARRWQLSCAALGVFLIAYFTTLLIRGRPYAAVSPVRPWALYFRNAISQLLGLTALLSSVGIGVNSGPGLYALGIVWLLFLAGIVLINSLIASGRDA